MSASDERKKAGRKSVGNTQLTVRLPAKVIAILNERARSEYLSKSQIITRLVLGLEDTK
jgi:Ribbon-helix-helix protein, copG family